MRRMRRPTALRLVRNRRRRSMRRQPGRDRAGRAARGVRSARHLALPDPRRPEPARRRALLPAGRGARDVRTRKRRRSHTEWGRGGAVSIKEAVGPERYAKVRQTLESCWPDDHAVVTDELVDELFLLAKHEWGSEDLKDVDLPKPTPELPKQQGRANAYYLGRATHARVAAPHSIFLGDLPLVRVALPPTGTSHTAPPIETEGGVVLPVDRLFPSIEVMWARYAPRLAHLG